MKLYQVEVRAYQTIEIEAENEEQAKAKAIDEGLDLSCSEWGADVISEENLVEKIEE
jgi:hypothetical protein